ncbi:MAG: hypothetical protein IPM53_01105 [Anaerolineaceae bacterium]|nr:hypothetical protein [Anaerolineaceae bacterium]
MIRNALPPQQSKKASPILVILVVTLIGPVFAVVLASAGLVLAPPQTSFTSVIYSGLFFLSLPLGLVALWIGRLQSKGCLAVAALTLFSFLVMATIAGPWLVAKIPGTSTQCIPLAATSPRGRYGCTSSSSDSGETREFILQGREGWPIMRAVPVESEQ